MAQTPDGLKKIMAALPSRARALVQSLAAQIQQLQQALQQAQADIKLGLSKTHLQEMVKAHDVEVSNETKRIDTASRERTALAVEEIRAGGKILDTHAQAGHDERASDRMIEAAEAAERTHGAGK